MIDQSKLNLKDRRTERLVVNRGHYAHADGAAKLMVVGQECVLTDPVPLAQKKPQFGTITKVEEHCYTVDVGSPLYVFIAAHADVYTPEDWAALVLTL